MSTEPTVNTRIPSWFDNIFFEEILQNYYKNEAVKVTRFVVKPFSAEGYTSSMFRAKVNLNTLTTEKKQTIDLIVKVATSESFPNFNLYDKEFEFYDDVAPRINEKLKELGELQISPECFGVCRTKKMMVLEDLSAKGYTVLPTRFGYNIPQAKAVLKRMAVFHAVGAVLYEENPSLFASKNFKSGHLSREIDEFNNMFTGSFDALLETISSWPDLSKYYDKLSRVRKGVVERWHQIYDLNPNHFNTLLHDDLWPPNIMMNGVNESVDKPFENVVFIDFQMCFRASPTIDLYFFLNTSVAETYRPHRFDELVEYYHDCLSNYLKELKYKSHIPTWSEFYAQYKERNLLAFITSCLEQAITIDNVVDISVDDLVKNDEYGMNIKRSLYQKPRVQEILSKMIPFYDQMGLFD